MSPDQLSYDALCLCGKLKAPYSFTIARSLRTKPLIICARSKENRRQRFSIFYDVNMSTKSKTDNVEAPRVVISK